MESRRCGGSKSGGVAVGGGVTDGDLSDKFFGNEFVVVPCRGMIDVCVVEIEDIEGGQFVKAAVDDAAAAAATWVM